MDTANMNPLDELVEIAKHDALLDGFINDRAAEILTLELPKLLVVLKEGKSARVADLEPIAETVETVLDTQDPNSALSSKIREIARGLADVLDEGLATVLKGEELLDRGLHLDLLSSHAQIISVFMSIKLNDKQKVIVAAEAAEESESDESDPAA